MSRIFLVAAIIFVTLALLALTVVPAIPNWQGWTVGGFLAMLLSMLPWPAVHLTP